MFDPKLFGAQIVDLVKNYVKEALTPIGAKLEEIEGQIKSIPEPEKVDVEEIAKQAAALIPAPDPLDQTEVVKEVLAQIRQPEDGKSVTLEDIQPLFDKAFGSWALDFERRAQDLFQKAVDKMPKPKDGIDALGFDDLSVEHDGEREITIKFSRGEEVKSFPFTLPVVLYRGVFKEGDDYTKSDSVTFGGSLFISQKDSPQGKPGESDDWKLSCKRGRDGKNYEPREPSTGSVKI